MPSLSLAAMRNFLSQSIASLNRNKLHGTLAEIAFRDHLRALGYHDRVSPGGWIARRKGPDIFAHSTAAIFPEVVLPAQRYPENRSLPSPSLGLHTICATFHQSGIASYFCAATMTGDEDPSSLQWHAVQLGLPSEQPYQPLIQALGPLYFTVRERNYNYLRYRTDASSIPDAAVPEEFSKEHLRVAFNTHFIVEPTDIDGIFWGQQHTYPYRDQGKNARALIRFGTVLRSRRRSFRKAGLLRCQTGESSLNLCRP